MQQIEGPYLGVGYGKDELDALETGCLTLCDDKFSWWNLLFMYGAWTCLPLLSVRGAHCEHCWSHLVFQTESPGAGDMGTSQWR